MAILALFGTGGTIYGIWQKSNADTQNAELSRFKAINDEYERLYKTVKDELEGIKAEVSHLKEQVDKYKAQVVEISATEHNCQEQLQKMKVENEKIWEHLKSDS